MFGIKEKVEAVKAIPDQIRLLFLMAITAIVIGVTALGFAMGVRNAH